MKTTTPKRIGAFFLAMIMCLSLFPTAAFAQDEGPGPEPQEIVESQEPSTSEQDDEAARIAAEEEAA